MLIFKQWGTNDWTEAFSSSHLQRKLGSQTNYKNFFPFTSPTFLFPISCRIFLKKTALCFLAFFLVQKARGAAGVGMSALEDGTLAPVECGGRGALDCGGLWPLGSCEEVGR